MLHLTKICLNRSGQGNDAVVILLRRTWWWMQNYKSSKIKLFICAQYIKEKLFSSHRVLPFFFFLAAGCIIGSGRNDAADAVPLLPVYWCSFHRPQKDDRLSQPTSVNSVANRELRTLGSQPTTLTAKPTPGYNFFVENHFLIFFS